MNDLLIQIMIDENRELKRLRDETLNENENLRRKIRMLDEEISKLNFRIGKFEGLTVSARQKENTEE